MPVAPLVTSQLSALNHLGETGLLQMQHSHAGLRIAPWLYLDGHSRTGLNPMLNSRKGRSPRSFVKSPGTLNYPIIQSTCDRFLLHIYIDTNAKWLHLDVFHLVLLHAPLALIYVNLDLSFDPLPETLLQPSAILLCIHHLVLLPTPLMAPWTLLLLTASSPGSPNSKRHGNHPTPPGICPRNLGLSRCRKTIQVVSKRLMRNM